MELTPTAAFRIKKKRGAKGKIERFPYAIQLEIERRLKDGETLLKTAAWLNEQESVKAILNEFFEGRPVSTTNIDKWRRGRPAVSIVARKGKIARLPLVIREQVNRRLLDGQSGRTIVEWLNGQPNVREIIAAQFQGSRHGGQKYVPFVTEHNVSEWRTHGGYEDWLKKIGVTA